MMIKIDSPPTVHTDLTVQNTKNTAQKTILMYQVYLKSEL